MTAEEFRDDSTGDPSRFFPKILCNLYDNSVLRSGGAESNVLGPLLVHWVLTCCNLGQFCQVETIIFRTLITHIVGEGGAEWGSVAKRKFAISLIISAAS